MNKSKYLIIGLIFPLMFTACGSEEVQDASSVETEAQQEVLSPVRVQKASDASLEDTEILSVSGVVESSRTKDIQPTVSGTVKEILVQAGDKVQGGQILIDLSGDPETQQLFQQESSLKKQVELQRRQIFLNKKSIKENTEISYNSTKSSLQTLYKTLNDTRTINQKTIASLQSDLIALEQVIEHVRRDTELAQEGTYLGAQQLEISASTSARSLLDSLWSVLHGSALPLAELIDDNLENDIEDHIEIVDDYLDALDYDDIYTDLPDIVDDLNQAVEDLEELIENAEDEDLSSELEAVKAAYVNALLQSLPGITQGIGGLENIMHQFDSYSTTTASQTSPVNLSLLQLEQQRDSLLRQIDRTSMQLDLQVTQIESQIISTKSALDSISWTLNSLADNSNPQIDGMLMQLELQEKQVQDLQATISRLVVKAPFAGIISDILVREGEEVAPGMPLASMIAGDLEVKAFVHSSDIASIKLGDKALVSISGDDAEYEARVASIAPTANSQTHEVEVGLDIKDSKFQAISATLLDVDFEIYHSEAEEGMFIPLNAIIFEASEPFVFVIKEDTKTAQRVDVELGDYLGDLVHVTDGISKDDLIAIEGQKFLKDGEKVSILTD